MDFTPEQIPDTLTVEHEGKPTLLRDVPFVKEAPDLPTLIKTGYDAHRELGSRVRIPTKGADGKFEPKTLAEFHKKIYEGGIFEPPPDSPEGYKITRPEKLTDGLSWNDEWAKELATTLHKHGIPVSAVPELLSLHEKALVGTSKILKTSFDEGLTAVKKEFGSEYETRRESVKRFTPMIFKTPEELEFFEVTGLADHPTFLTVMMRLAPLMEQDSSFMAEMKRSEGSVMTPEEVRGEVGKIMSDKTHPMYTGYWQKDPKVMAYIDDLYKKAVGDGKIELG